MHLRELRKQDVPLMLEWMHDESIAHDLQTDFASKTIEDCEKFIDDSLLDAHNLHLAIADESDIYQGTVSLKNIFDRNAEFAITIRSCAMGKGIAVVAMKKIIEVGFEEKGLDSIYWCVSPDNKRAIRFYDKNGYHRVSPDALNIRGGGTAKHRFEDTIGISSQERKGGTEFPDKEPEHKTEYGFSFPSFCYLKR